LQFERALCVAPVFRARYPHAREVRRCCGLATERGARLINANQAAISRSLLQRANISPTSLAGRGGLKK
jgi:hypothetical protein